MDHPTDQDTALAELEAALASVQQLVQQSSDGVPLAHHQAGQKRKSGGEQGPVAAGKRSRRSRRSR